MPQVHENYDSAQARNYDKDREVEEHWGIENSFVEGYFSGRTDIAALLDAPVGTGRFLSYYPRASKVAGIDASAEMLEMASARVRELGLENVSIQRGDIFSLPFSDGQFDATVCWRFAHLFPPARIASAFSELARVTAGEVLIQAYLRGAMPSRLASRIARMPKKILGLFRPDRAAPRWSHIQAYFHSKQVFETAIAAAGLTIVRKQFLCAYNGNEVCVFVLKRK